MFQKLQVCAVALCVLTCLIFADASRASLQQAGSPTSSTIEARIKRVENGLLPPTRIKGEAATGMKLPDRMQFYKSPAVSVAVINEGRMEWARAYGTLEAGGKVPATVTSVFQAASLSKPVTAMVALRLVQERKLDLDADVNGSLKSWKIPENEFTKTQKVTLRHLLSHSAGLTVPGFLGYASDAPLPTVIQMLDGTPPETTRQMLTPQFENSGLGLFIDGTDRSRRFSHSGSNVGYKAYLVGYFDSGQGAVVMTNSENGAQLMLEVLRSIAAEYGWPDYQPRERVITKIDPSIYDAYVGEYEVAPGLILKVTKEGDKLFSQSPGQPRSEMLAESETTFFLRDIDAQFTFVREGEQTVRVVIRRGAREFQARKIK